VREDANDEQTISGRIAARWSPTEAIDAMLTYYYQNQDVGARQISHHDGFGTSEYATAMRVLEPNERENELTALEITADLGFAELTSATGFSKYDEKGHRDQTDFLISLEFSYELFPEFTAFTTEELEEETFTQELRLLSTHEGPFEWILGAFYNDYELDALSAEYTPNFDLFAVDVFGGFGPRPDSLEYLALTHAEIKETAVYGELKWNITDAWQMTVGARWYDYDLETEDSTALPLCDTVFFGEPPDSINPFGPCGGGISPGGQEEDGTLFKFNTSYYLTDDVMAYFTYSEGYRIGGDNGLVPCPNPLPPTQLVCGLPSELEFVPDETQNYEVGLRSSWFDNRLVVNGALYFVDWSEPQIDGATQNGLSPITINGSGAESIGGEVGFNLAISENWSLRGSYSYTKAELSDDAPNLITAIAPPGFGPFYVDGRNGDRLPGSPEHQGSLFVDFSMPLDNGMVFEFNYGVWAVSDVLTRTGGRGGGEALPGYAVNNASWSISADQWTATLYADNLFDKWAATSARDTRQFQQQVANIDGDPVTVRRYYYDILAPRQIGLRFTYTFESL
jgi:outer membrane receptor protein involved in Fe transport